MLVIDTEIGGALGQRREMLSEVSCTVNSRQTGRHWRLTVHNTWRFYPTVSVVVLITAYEV